MRHNDDKWDTADRFHDQLRMVWSCPVSWVTLDSPGRPFAGTAGMKKKLESLIKNSFLYYPLYNWKNRRFQAKELDRWEHRGRPVPPPHIVKQRTIRRYAEQFGLKVFVETGTYHGDMVEAMRNQFETIYSIELSEDLYERAVIRFKRARNIELIHGDSASELGNIASRIDQPALFWLDGHFSGGDTAIGHKATPIREELGHILRTEIGRHVIIIDDARCFGSDPSYPDLEDLIDHIKSIRPGLDVVVENDSIRVTPDN